MGEVGAVVHGCWLSVIVTSDDQLLADSFDEQHVLYALEVLKVAGSFTRYMRSLEGKSRERLLLLCKRIAAHSAREKQLQEAREMTASGGKSSFQLSDTMSVVEIHSLLTKAVCVGSDDEESSLAIAALQRLVVQEEHAVALHPEAEETAKRLVSSCHIFVYDVSSSVP